MTGQPQDPDGQTRDLARKDAEFGVLQRVSSEINSTFDLDEIYRISLATMDDLFGFHHSLILLLDDGGETLTVVASRGYEGQATGGKAHVGVGVIGMVAKKRRALHMNNLGVQRSYVSAQRLRMVEAGRSEEIQATIPVPGLPDVESHIAIPLMVKDSLIGVFSVESNQPSTFTDHDETLVTIVANQTASAIQSARLNRALQRSNDELEERVRLRTAELERELQIAQELLKDAKNRVEGPLLGDSPAVQQLREAIRRHAATDRTLLIDGPPGAGKEASARAIHADSARRSGAFIHVRCTQLPSGEHASLFGSLDADELAAAKAGKLDLADGGTLYLDGVEALSRPAQERLFKAMSRLDRARTEGHRPSPDVRVILSTQRDLSRAAQSAQFDLALYQLVSRERLSVPALCDRPEDLPVLVEHFLRKHARQFGKNVERVSDESMQRLRAYGWPGNIRELHNVLERATIVATGPVVEIAEETLAGGISLGSYKLVEKIGAGGMGEVWLGKHDLLARPAAVKLIRADKMLEGEGQQHSERFQREARTTANLRSPHTVQLYDFGVSESGTFYYVMEFLHGMDLAVMVRRFGPLAPARVVMLLEQACRSLSEAHEHGLIHRDIKPANLFVTALGPQFDFLKILDFGMVKTTLQENDVTLTPAGTAKGTPAFMPPELILGESVDGRADLYSLGCVAFWALTGMLVFDAKNPTAMMMQHLQGVPQAPSAVSEVPIPEALDRIVLHCLQKRPDERPDSAAELGEALARVQFAQPWTPQRAQAWWMLHAPDQLGPRR